MRLPWGEGEVMFPALMVILLLGRIMRYFLLQRMYLLFVLNFFLCEGV
jgi:hypothetical protein